MADTADEMFCPFTKAQCREDCALIDEVATITMGGVSRDFSCAIMQLSLALSKMVETWPDDGEVEKWF